MEAVVVETPGLANVTLRAKGCRDLPLQTDGNSVLITWELSDEEIELLTKTKRLYQIIHHKPSDFPPLSLSPVNPLENLSNGEETQEETKEQE